MLSWLKQRIPGATPAFERRLADYPPYAQPVAKPGDQLRPEEAQRNLDALLAQRASRLETLAALLREQAGIDLAPVLAGGDPAPMLNALHAWLNTVLPPLLTRHAALATRQRWLSSTRQGDEIVFSFLMDLALLLGELIQRGRPNFQWALDLDPVNRRDKMTSWQRPVLIAHRPDGSPVVIDVEEAAVIRFFQAKGSDALLNGWRNLVVDARAGAYDRAL